MAVVGFYSLIMLIFTVFVSALIIYTLILAIKALKIYIEKNNR